MSLFQKSKSTTLKSLNFILILNIVTCLIVLAVSIINVILPADYTYGRRDYTTLYDTSAADYYTERIMSPTSVRSEINIKPIIASMLSLTCAIGALFVCNKWRGLFDIAKPSGLKALTAASVITITDLVTLILVGIVYESFSYSNIVILFVIISAIAIYTLAPIVAKLLHIFNINNSKWFEYVNFVMVLGLCGTLVSLANTLFYIQSSNCDYRCDKNALPRTITIEVVIAIIFALGIFVVKKLCNKRRLDEIKKESYLATPEKIQSENTPTD